jgi:hypothetical protein
VVHLRRLIWLFRAPCPILSISSDLVTWDALEKFSMAAVCEKYKVHAPVTQSAFRSSRSRKSSATKLSTNHHHIFLLLHFLCCRCLLTRYTTTCNTCWTARPAPACPMLFLNGIRDRQSHPQLPLHTYISAQIPVSISAITFPLTDARNLHYFSN